MAERHAPEVYWRAEVMFCVEGRSFRSVAEGTGVAEKTLRAWAKRRGWQARRGEMAELAASIRADAVRARAHVLRKLLETEDVRETVQLSYAVSSLEKTAVAVEKAARERDFRAAADLPASPKTGEGGKEEPVTVTFMERE